MSEADRASVRAGDASMVVKTDREALSRSDPPTPLPDMLTTPQKQIERRRARAKQLKQIEAEVIHPSLQGEADWPIPILALGQKAYLRLEAGKTRIIFDWVAPAEYRTNLDASEFPMAASGRVKHQVPSPDRPVNRSLDAGHNPELAVTWAIQYLKDLVRVGEFGTTGRRPSGGTFASSGKGPTTADLVAEWKLSPDYTNPELSEDTRTQQNKWMDFLVQVYPGSHFPAKRTTAATERKIVERYPESWTRVLPDGSAVDGHRGRDAKYNTAVKVAEHWRRMVKNAMKVIVSTDEDGEPVFLLEHDPYRRIHESDLPQQNPTAAKPRGKATDAYANSFERALAQLNPQALPICAIERRTGRRVGEARKMSRNAYLKTPDQIEAALYAMECRDAYQDLHVRPEEIPAVAQRYAESGGALYLSKENVKQVNQARSRRDDTFDERRYDVVIPIGPNLAAILDHYLETYWEPLGLPDDAPLFPAERPGRAGEPPRSRPTPKSTVEGWTKAAKRKVAGRLGHQRMPNGKTHPLRKRTRSILKDAGAHADTVGFYCAWSRRDTAGLAMDHIYAHITPDDLLSLVPILDDPNPVSADG